MSQGSFVSLPARESLDVTVGRRVHMIMWERRITQTALGRMVGIDQSSLGKRLRGERGWSLDDLRVVAEALNVSKAYLLGEEGHEDPDPQTED
ncbi:MAG: helix-turn-helix transcriptional regulator [Microbacterium ginsengisoli]|nr:helix-turn-helix transcriptional regulator [Microbacterium ginsengisoli]